MFDTSMRFVVCYSHSYGKDYQLNDNKDTASEPAPESTTIS